MNIETRTIIDKKEETIYQTGWVVNKDGGRVYILERVINLKDTDIRGALIDIGWTPPVSC